MFLEDTIRQASYDALRRASGQMERIFQPFGKDFIVEGLRLINKKKIETRRRQ